MPIWMPMRQLQLWPARKESDFDTVFQRIKAVCSNPTKWQVFKFEFSNNSDLGGVTENFEFKINDDTEVHYSCSATLNGEVFVFGGYSTNGGNNKRKQVNLKQGLNSSLKGYSGIKNCWMWA